MNAFGYRIELRTQNLKRLAYTAGVIGLGSLILFTVGYLTWVEFGPYILVDQVTTLGEFRGEDPSYEAGYIDVVFFGVVMLFVAVVVLGLGIMVGSWLISVEPSDEGSKGVDAE